MLAAAAMQPLPFPQRTVEEALTGEAARVVDYAIDGQLLRCYTAPLDAGEIPTDIPAGFVAGECRRIGVDGIARARHRGGLQVYIRTSDHSVLAIRAGRITWYRTYGDIGVYFWVCERVIQKPV